MNYSAIVYILGWVLEFEALFLALPCIVALVRKEDAGIAFAITMVICFVVGFLAKRLGKKNSVFYAKEGLVSVALSWIVLSLFGALPFYLSGEIPSFADALFESVSGFTTTGASILADVESLSQCVLFWRSFTHWIGGMGVLVFVLAILPLTGGYNVHLLRAESTGPQVGKLAPKLHTSAMILYGIYVAITFIEIFLLLLGGVPFLEALELSFGTAGTGGFGIKNDSMAGYSPYVQNVVSVFMILCGINFNVFYLLILGKVKQIFKSEEAITYLAVIAVAVTVISLNIREMFSSIWEAGHHALFQVGSIITSTGYSTTDFDLWPETAKTILLMLMFMGACAGSTGGGIKVSRILILIKMFRKEFRTFSHPRSIKQFRIDGRVVPREVQYSTAVFMITYLFIFIVSLFLITLENNDFETSFSAVVTTLSNIGPGFSLVGPTQNFGFFSSFSKYVFIFNMLAGRLELFPILVLFSPRTWKR